METLISIAIGVLVAALALLLFVGALRAVQAARGNTQNITLQQALDAILPYIYKAIWSADKEAQLALTNFGKTLTGADKKVIADSMYNLLPDVIMFGTIAIPLKVVKLLITRDVWANTIQTVYDQMAAFVLSNQNYLHKKVQDLVPDQFEMPPFYAGTAGNVPTPTVGAVG